VHDSGAPRGLVWLLAIALGALIGAASLVGDAVGIRLLNGLANAAAPWLVVAFASGTVHRDVRAGVVAGVLSLLVAVAVYYLGISIVFGPDRSYAGPLIVLWLGAAVVGGGVFGAAGCAWRAGSGRRRAVAGAMPAAALFAEAAHRWLQVAASGAFDLSGTYAQVMLAEAAGGLVALWLMARGPERRTVLLAAAGLAAAGLAAFIAVERLAHVLADL
jgi:Family of unknown function (DUF6518)